MYVHRSASLRSFVSAAWLTFFSLKAFFLKIKTKNPREGEAIAYWGIILNYIL